MPDVTVTVGSTTSVSVSTTGAASPPQTYAVEKFSGAGGTGYTTLTANQMSGAAAITFATAFKANTATLFKNGVLMESTVDYSEAVGRTGVTLLVAVESTDKIEVRYVNA